MQVAIIKYNAGNIRSVDYGLRRIGITPLITEDPEIIRSADKVVFPGQGEAGTTMAYLKERGLDVLIKSLQQPVLGICIGMQLMCTRSEESGGTQCLGIFDTEVKKFVAEKHEDKIPHIGWNSLSDLKGGIFTNISDNQYTYFVHSYYIPVNKDTTATCNYILPFSAAMHKDNFYATQFHPEKSGSVGETILRNFINI
ncbi:MAG: imidazole glycerol phosphate synthase subunit HisH [Tannerella sp.]|nr:imidazole glycerol phosphate synthase subunit HisH [Tannerella sp.]